VLTGLLRDGAQRIRAIKRRGGRVLVQDPTAARAAGMPSAIIATGCVDFVLPLDRIAPALVALTIAPGGRGDARGARPRLGHAVTAKPRPATAPDPSRRWNCWRRRRPISVLPYPRMASAGRGVGAHWVELDAPTSHSRDGEAAVRDGKRVGACRARFG
jgi:hypothetical protein